METGTRSEANRHATPHHTSLPSSRHQHHGCATDDFGPIWDPIPIYIRDISTMNVDEEEIWLSVMLLVVHLLWAFVTRELQLVVCCACRCAWVKWNFIYLMNIWARVYARLLLVWLLAIMQMQQNHVSHNILTALVLNSFQFHFHICFLFDRKFLLESEWEWQHWTANFARKRTS